MKCNVCERDVDRHNSDRAECSHVDCPHRRHAWSERGRLGVSPRPAPARKRDNEADAPLDKLVRQKHKPQTRDDV